DDRQLPDPVQVAVDVAGWNDRGRQREEINRIAWHVHKRIRTARINAERIAQAVEADLLRVDRQRQRCQPGTEGAVEHDPGDANFAYFVGLTHRPWRTVVAGNEFDFKLLVDRDAHAGQGDHIRLRRGDVAIGW